MTDKQIIIDEFNASEYAKTAFELAKETLAEKDQLREYYDKLLQRKEQEIEELKRQLEEESKLGHKAVQEEADTFFDLLKVQKELDKLKQTFEEIREIADDLILHADDISCRCCDSGAIYAEKILIKIDEVIDD